MKNTNALQNEKSFTTNWAFVYGLPKAVLNDKISQFFETFLRQTHQVLNVKLQIPTTYYPKESGQKERVNRTIIESLRRFI